MDLNTVLESWKLGHTIWKRASVTLFTNWIVIIELKWIRNLFFLQGGRADDVLVSGDSIYVPPLYHISAFYDCIDFTEKYIIVKALTENEDTQK